MERKCEEKEAPVVVPWEAWGPNVTRWLPRSLSNPHRWNLTAAGARAVVMVDSSGSTVILDFHAPRVNLAKAQYRNRTAGSHIWVQDEETAITSEMFKESITSRLPYTVRVVGKIEHYNDLVMGEEQLVGVKVR